MVLGSFTPSDHQHVAAALDLAGVRAGDHVLDIGSGDGRVCVAAAARGAIARGIEIDKELARKAAEAHAQVPHVSLEQGDAMQVSWTDATVVLACQPVTTFAAITAKFLADCRPGTRLCLDGVECVVHP